MLDLFSKYQVKENESMSKHTTFRVGGPAKIFVSPRTVDELIDIRNICRKNDIPYYILGNGSNVLFLDQGYDGVIIEIGDCMNEITVSGNTIKAMAGAMLGKVAYQAKEAGLTGMEFAAGIPGTVGGAMVMNAGAYGGEMKDIVREVEVLMPDDSVKIIPCEDMEFSYRHSVISGDMVVLGTVFSLTEGNKDAIVAKMDELKVARVSKQPLEYPSAGSTFKRPEGYFAGKLVQDAGLRGYRVGGAMVSEKHCGFVINYDNATADDILTLIKNVQEKVMNEFQVMLEPEVRIVL